MQPPPFDFFQLYTTVHSEEDMVCWVMEGMPAFDDVLSDQDIRDVLSYIEAEQKHFDTAANRVFCRRLQVE